MMKRSSILVLGVLVCNLVQATPPASRPVTPDAKTQRYLDLAVVSLAAWDGEPGDKPWSLFSPHYVAEQLMNMRGNDADREQARRMLTIAPSLAPKAPLDRAPIARLHTEIHLRASLGERDELTNLAERLLKLSNERPEGERAFVGTAEAAVAFGLIGQDERCIELAGDHASTVATMLAEANRWELLERLFKSFDVTSDTYGSHASRWAGTLAANGRIDDALATLEGIVRLDQRFREYIEFAGKLDAIGRQEWAALALKRANQVWDQMPDEIRRRSADVGRLHDLLDAGHKAFVIEAYHRAVAMKPARQDVWSLHHIGSLAARLNDRPQLSASIAGLQQWIANPRPDERYPTEAGFMLAAVLVYAGQADEAMKVFETARALDPKEDLSLSEGFAKFLTAKLRSEDPVQAIDFATKHFGDAEDNEFSLGLAVAALLLRDDPHRASEVSGRYRKYWHLQLGDRVRIIMHLSRAKQDEEAIRLIRSLPDPRDRAEVALLVAREMQGTRLVGIASISIR